MIRIISVFLMVPGTITVLIGHYLDPKIAFKFELVGIGILALDIIVLAIAYIRK